ncbi:MAG: putative porin [Candidatus Omnitrophota bacterium]
MVKKIWIMVLAGWFLGLNPLCFAATTQVDALIEKLVEKGILDRQESIKLKSEIAEDEKIVREEGLKQSLPAWVREMKLKGDFRLRYQYEKKKGSNTNAGNTTERDRARIRFRLGAETKVNDQTKVLFGLATGGTDPRSTNQTLENSFELKDIRLDYVYGEYAPFSWASFLGGRMKNPLWEPGDLLWDTDVNPEGLAAKFKGKVNNRLETYLNTGAFVLDENAAASDPWIFVLQPGLKWKVNDKTTLNVANAYYGSSQVRGAILDHSAGSNTNNGRRGLLYGLSAFSPSVELAVKDPLQFMGIGLPYASFFGEYAHNLPSADSGYLAGLKIGHEKVSNARQWQLRYFYTMLATNAWLDTLPDSDRYGGRTGIRGHELLLTYGLGKNWSLDLDYYRTDLTTTHADTAAKTENLFQADLNFKF